MGDVPEYSDAENQRLAENLYALEIAVQSGGLIEHDLDIDLLTYFHRQFFEGVRDHGGQVRRTGWGSEAVTFGPNRSVIRENVLNALKDVFSRARQSIASFDDNRDDPNYEEGALHLAAWVHAESLEYTRLRTEMVGAVGS